MHLSARTAAGRCPKTELDGDHPLIKTGGVTPVVRSIMNSEHADVLAEALYAARHRLLVISPFATKSVVNDDFISALKQRLLAGVEITIACRYDAGNRDSCRRALRRLNKLAARYEKFTLVRVKDVHAKILIFDSICVQTSYNWLSSRNNDFHQSSCIERGTLISFPDRVDREYALYQMLLDVQGISPT
jgi:hypothetical protein